MNLDLRIRFYRFLSSYGMLLVLVLLCAYFSWATWTEQNPTGADAGRQLAKAISRRTQRETREVRVLIVARDIPEDIHFASALRAELLKSGVSVVETVNGQPVDARRALEKIGAAGGQVDLIACNAAAAEWNLFADLSAFSATRQAKVMQPASYRWPDFLKADNLRNVANQIVVIAIVAIGMTMVIITGGIDLSVGSLIALSAVISTRLIRDLAGAEQAGAVGMAIACATGIGACAAAGLCSGVIVTLLDIPAFIVTLGMMLVASGVGFILAEGQSIYQVPDSFVWLGRGADLFNIPNAVVLMLIAYAAGYLVMERMALGRYVYAVGGNRQAARFSGVPLKRVLVFVYTISGALAGLGGVIIASQLKSGAPTYGVMYELYVIAAVVVGGTSLAGGQGKILGTLIGAFIIAVIQNGMNLTGVESYTQKVVLGLLILGAVSLDRFRRYGLELLVQRSAAGHRKP